MLDKLENKTYKAKIKQGYDPKDGYFYFVELPEGLTEELGWNEKTKLKVEIKLGESSNVLLISKEKK